MIDSGMIQLAEQAIKRGERTRVLMEILLSEMGGFTITDDIDFFKELKRVQDEQNEALTMMSQVVQDRLKAKKTDTEE